MLDSILDWVKGMLGDAGEKGADAVSGATETAQDATGGAADGVIGVAGDHYGEQWQDMAGGMEGHTQAAQEAFADPALAAQEGVGEQIDAAGQTAEGYTDAAGQVAQDPDAAAADALRDRLGGER